MPSNKIYYVILISIIVSVFLIDSISFREDHNWGGDFSQYIAQAKSLNDGTIDKLIENSTFRHEKDDRKIIIGPLLYPWGFPILLSPIYHMFGINIFVMKFYINLFFLFSLPIIYLTFKDKITHIQNILIIAIIAYNPYFYQFKEHILSDIPFLFFSLFSVFLIQKIIIEKKYFLNEIFCYLLIGLFMFISYSIRGHGIILLPTLFIAQIADYKCATKNDCGKYLVVLKYLIPYIAFFVLLIITNIILPSGNTYTDILALITLKGLSFNFIYYAMLLSRFFGGKNAYFPSNLIPISGIIIYVMTIPFFILGLAEKIKKDYLYFVFSIFLVILNILWPPREGLRYIFPVIPFYLYFLFAGANKAGFILSNKNIKIDLSLMIGIPLILIFLLTVSANLYKQYNMNDHIIPGPYHKDSVELFNYISLNTAKNSIIIFRKPRVMTLYTNRKSASITNFSNIIKSGADYIACRKNRQLDLEIQKIAQSVDKILGNSTFNLYQLNTKK